MYMVGIPGGYTCGWCVHVSPNNRSLPKNKPTSLTVNSFIDCKHRITSPSSVNLLKNTNLTTYCPSGVQYSTEWIKASISSQLLTSPSVCLLSLSFKLTATCLTSQLLPFPSVLFAPCVLLARLEHAGEILGTTRPVFLSLQRYFDTLELTLP